MRIPDRSRLLDLALVVLVFVLIAGISLTLGRLGCPPWACWVLGSVGALLAVVYLGSAVRRAPGSGTVYRCGCGCGREQSTLGIDAELAATIGWRLDPDPALVRSPLCRGADPVGASRGPRGGSVDPDGDPEFAASLVDEIRRTPRS